MTKETEVKHISHAKNLDMKRHVYCVLTDDTHQLHSMLYRWLQRKEKKHMPFSVLEIC